ncbi:hypothetical protein FOA52_009810 [Chlamydomonas sp. UWO 241]|nr:hypothetical protein FOA52_009810 [Chlamydomonas sp. UWO 241]
MPRHEHGSTQAKDTHAAPSKTSAVIQLPHSVRVASLTGLLPSSSPLPLREQSSPVGVHAAATALPPAPAGPRPSCLTPQLQLRASQQPHASAPPCDISIALAAYR